MTTETGSLSVWIVEDQSEVRTGMAFIINSYADFYCTSFPTADEVLQALELSRPKVILMDINLPGMDGIECTRRVKSRFPEVLIMMCTVFEDHEKIFNALKAGASGYILKRSAGESLIDAIKELVKGGAPMSSDIARKVVSSFQSPAPFVPGTDGLTRRESEILHLIGKGYGNKEIADTLCVSLNTVRTHIYHIYEKLHVRNRVEAINKSRLKN